MYRSIEEVTKSLTQTIPTELTKKVNGYTYVPWNVSAKIMNTLFGPLGWTSTVIEVKPVENLGFSAIVRVACQAIDEEGNIITGSHDGVGFGELNTTSSGKPLTDTAIKTAASDAFSRAVKYLGEALGLSIYDKIDPVNQETEKRPGTSLKKREHNGNTREASPTMLEAMKWHGVPESVIDEVGKSFEESYKLLGLIKTQKLTVDEALDRMGFEPVTY